MKDAYYFSHDSNARNDERIAQLRVSFGNNGYAIYFMVVEVLREATGYKFNSDAIGGLSIAISQPEELVENVLERCSELHLFENKDGYFWSESLLRRMEKKEKYIEKQRESGLIGSLKRWHNEPNSNPMPLKESKGKESKVYKRGIPPPLPLVKDFFKELNKPLEADPFYDYFQSNGWKVGGKAPMKDWKAAARNWTRRSFTKKEEDRYPVFEKEKETKVDTSPAGKAKIRKLIEGIGKKP